MSAMLDVTDVHTYYDSDHILQGVTLEVQPGQVAVVLGRNGAGKTTLVRSIVGLTPPRHGRISFEGREVTGLPPDRIARLGIGLVPQGRRIFPSLTVFENLTLGARPAVSRGGWTVARVLELFPILGERRNAYGGTLSGGEQQMLACARALLGNPTLMLMDEPSEGLAPQRLRQLGEVIGELRRGGLSVLLVEQKFGFALTCADHIFVLSKGTIAYSGAPDALAADRTLLESLLGVAPSSTFTSGAARTDKSSP
jgi:branched-chain amino acid transport system ATP-binding protein